MASNGDKARQTKQETGVPLDGWAAALYSSWEGGQLAGRAQLLPVLLSLSGE